MEWLLLGGGVFPWGKLDLLRLLTCSTLYCDQQGWVLLPSIGWLLVLVDRLINIYVHLVIICRVSIPICSCRRNRFELDNLIIMGAATAAAILENVCLFCEHALALRETDHVGLGDYGESVLLLRWASVRLIVAVAVHLLLLFILKFITFLLLEVEGVFSLNGRWFFLRTLLLLTIWLILLFGGRHS